MQILIQYIWDGAWDSAFLIVGGIDAAGLQTMF